MNRCHVPIHHALPPGVIDPVAVGTRQPRQLPTVAGRETHLLLETLALWLNVKVVGGGEKASDHIVPAGETVRIG